MGNHSKCFKCGELDEFCVCRTEAAPAQPLAANPAWLDRDGRMTNELRSFMEGMSVSMDVSTGEHDAGNRYFGIINEVMDDNEDKNGVTFLVYDAQPNFAAPAPATPTAHCRLPPLGWACTRPSGHEGPCAAWPTVEIGDEIEEKHARPDNQGAAQDEGHDAGGTCASRGAGAHQHNEHREVQSGAHGRDGVEDSGSAGVSDRREVRTPVKAASSTEGWQEQFDGRFTPTAPQAAEEQLRDFAAKLAADQKPLDPEIAAVLSSENLFKLYAGDDTAPQAATTASAPDPILDRAASSSDVSGMARFDAAMSEAEVVQKFSATTASAPTWTQEQLDQIGRGADEILAKMGTPRMLGDDGSVINAATTASASTIKTWQERCDWWSERSSTKLMVEAMKAEIADLRNEVTNLSAALARAPLPVQASGDRDHSEGDHVG